MNVLSLLLITLLSFIPSLPQPPPCAVVAVTLAQAQIQPGNSQTISSDVTNCGDTKTKFRITVTVTDAVGSTVILRNDAHMVDPAQSITLQDTYTVSPTGPLGTYRVISIAFVTQQGNTFEVARDEETFQVTAD